MLDFIIKNGTVIDGTGTPGFSADVGIQGDTIVEVAQAGQLTVESAQTIDASGSVVTPGFIDLHTHSDSSFLIDSHADSKLMQGVTLELFGNCGMSFCAPLIGIARDMFKERMDRDYAAWKSGASSVLFPSLLLMNASSIETRTSVPLSATSWASPRL